MSDYYNVVLVTNLDKTKTIRIPDANLNLNDNVVRTNVSTMMTNSIFDPVEVGRVIGLKRVEKISEKREKINLSL